MKIKSILFLLCFCSVAAVSGAQHVRVRMNFPVGINIGAPGPSPYSGAVWIGPEWQWRGGTYVSVPGYWARPQRYRAVWIPGYWKYTRHGYRWVPGHWK